MPAISPYLIRQTDCRQRIRQCGIRASRRRCCQPAPRSGPIRSARRNRRAPLRRRAKLRRPARARRAPGPRSPVTTISRSASGARVRVPERRGSPQRQRRHSPRMFGREASHLPNRGRQNARLRSQVGREPQPGRPRPGGPSQVLRQLPWPSAVASISINLCAADEPGHSPHEAEGGNRR